MKLFFLNIYNGRIERGSEIFVVNLAHRLSRRHEVTVVQSGPENKASYREKVINGVPFITNSGPSDFFYHLVVLYFTLKALPFLLSENYDWLIPVNGRFQVLICRMLRGLKKCRVLVSGHAGVGREDHFNLKFGRPDVFVALTPAAFSWAKNLTSSPVVRLIPNGVNFRKTTASHKLRTQFNHPLVITIGALLPYKRIGLLIRAVSRLSGVNLLVVGDGPMKKEITDSGERLLPGRFYHFPHIRHELIQGYYRAADVFSLPSESSEAFGLVYLEALAANLPVVAPDDENRRFILGKAGFYCKVEDAVSYAKAIKKALSAGPGSLQRKQAEKFSWDNVSSQYEQVFENKA
ncbi:MAG: Glycosyl transferase, group 1 [Candidatus Gottesmanbacteria bacterium GW2011_GWA2_43_14]|uniref:Glycosyl transferase, group 1 n=1 Tax=Candidatus Gottesmanbacteria bacterium GW2011_GWA2_43_14 TaxID=1618443 RepID=A0A0G1DM36_9BACT|nr:MAG: Glycosyl transferase, group 1 [Candidatus Gottesmanbacteria bacterium GW2011_GWA2_43_14]